MNNLSTIGLVLSIVSLSVMLRVLPYTGWLTQDGVAVAVTISLIYHSLLVFIGFVLIIVALLQCCKKNKYGAGDRGNGK